ncbi:MAG: hypothetical protein EOP56_18845 [Sphingobacteriales bacterium]|nr:MAG: hypothetical protein EOP56_18845 [Sphingobacteriales bacterium]
MTLKNKWNKLSADWKWKLLIAAIGLLFFASYFFNFRKTAAVITEYNELKAFADTMPDANIGMSEVTIPQEEPKLNDYSSETILSGISTFCEENEIFVNEIAQSSYQDSGSYIIETNKITLNGSYRNILLLLYDIEKKKKMATINAVHWEMQKDKSSSEYILLATLYIRQIKRENEKS